MIDSISPLNIILKLNTRLFINCLGGVDDELARTRINDRTNNLAFLACHLVDARHYLASCLAVETENPFKHLLENAKGIEDLAALPAVDEIRMAWTTVSRVLADRFVSLTEAELAVASPQRFPVDDQTLLGGLAFLLEHDSYHVGQMAFLRKCFGLGAMSYSSAVSGAPGRDD